MYPHTSRFACFWLSVLFVALSASSTLGFEITRQTKLAKVTLTFTERAQKEPCPALRNWGSGENSAPNKLDYPALLSISYVTEWGSYRLPCRLTAGIGRLNLQLLADLKSTALTVRDRDGWVVITLCGADGASAYRAEWQIAPGTGWVIRFTHDGEMPGPMDRPGGPELLGGQASELHH
jgi:hypothetical protein